MNTPVPTIEGWDWIATCEWYAEARQIDDSKARFQASIAGVKLKRERRPNRKK